jgi:hypothetical protein
MRRQVVFGVVGVVGVGLGRWGAFTGVVGWAGFGGLDRVDLAVGGVCEQWVWVGSQCQVGGQPRPSGWVSEGVCVTAMCVRG